MGRILVARMRGRGSAGKFRGSSKLVELSRREAGGGEIQTNVPALGKDYAHEKYDQEATSTDPAVCGVRGAFVEIGLI